MVSVISFTYCVLSTYRQCETINRTTELIIFVSPWLKLRSFITYWQLLLELSQRCFQVLLPWVVGDNCNVTESSHGPRVTGASASVRQVTKGQDHTH